MVMFKVYLMQKDSLNALKHCLQVYDSIHVSSKPSYLKITLWDRSWGTEEIEVRTLIFEKQS